MIRLTLYTRPGCHLCEALKDVVDAVAREQPMALREVDISGDVALERRFGTEIPVLACGERVVARVRTSRRMLREALRSVTDQNGVRPSAGTTGTKTTACASTHAAPRSTPPTDSST